MFREYDIRGPADTHLTAELARKIGAAFGAHLNQVLVQPEERRHRVCVGYDGRKSSPHLAEAVTQGLLSQGVDVVEVGLGPTPFVYWAEHVLKTEASVMITGSHNGPQDNGLKLSLQRKPFFGPQLQELRARMQHPSSDHSPGTYSTRRDLLNAYGDSLVQSCPLGGAVRSLKVVWDPGNGAVCAVLPQLVRALPCESLILHGEVDGSFPHRSPDPTQRESLLQLQETVVREKADVGFAFDGDGDRLVLVDPGGCVWMGDEALTFMAEHLAPFTPSLSCVADIKTSPFLLERLTQRGIPSLVAKTGHVHIKVAMQQAAALLGGEVSGHFFFRDHHWGFDDGLYAALRLLRILEQGASLLAWKKSLAERYSSPEIRLTCPEDQKDTVVNALKKRLLSTKGVQVETLDGVRVTQQGGWWLLRPSQTEPALVVRWEALDRETFQELGSGLRAALAEWDLSLVWEPPFTPS